MDVLMPQLGETVAEGTIKVWFKAVGDAVAPGDNLFEIETDKVNMEVPSVEAGILSEIRAQEGETVPVGTVVAVIGDAVTSQGAASASKPSAKPQPASPPAASSSPQAHAPQAPGPPAAKASEPSSIPTPASAPSAASKYLRYTEPVVLDPSRRRDPFQEVVSPDRSYGPATLSNGINVTPLARRLASEADINLMQVKGSGPRGRIVAKDIVAAASAAPRAAAVSAPAIAAPAGPTLAQVKALYKHVAFEEIPLDGMRRVIAKRLVEAVQTVPHFYLSMDVQMDRALSLREELNASAPKDTAGAVSFKLSVNDLIVKAFALALQRVPAANAVWAEDRILRFRQSDVGVAVAVDGGLLTPVVRNADTKTIFAISSEMKDLSARARERKLKPEEYQGGSAAVSNLGMFGIREFSAIINPPHSTILAVGASERRPVETEQGGVRFITQMTVTLSCDHRVVDGALGAQLLAAFKAVLESPAAMLI